MKRSLKKAINAFKVYYSKKDNFYANTRVDTVIQFLKANYRLIKIIIISK